MKLLCALTGTTLALGFASIASADTSVSDAYGGQGTNVPSTIIVTPTDSKSGDLVTPGSAGSESGTLGVTGESETQGVAGATATSPGSGGQGGTAPATAAAPTAPETVASGSLPFTGLDVGLMIAGGLLLVGFGLGMRRLSRGAAPVA